MIDACLDALIKYLQDFKKKRQKWAKEKQARIKATKAKEKQKKSAAKKKTTPQKKTPRKITKKTASKAKKISKPKQSSQQKSTSAKSKLKSASLKEIGPITHYFNKIGVVVVKISSGPLKVGDEVIIQTKTGEFKQKVKSLQIESVDVKSARKGQLVGMKVLKPVSVGDKVFKLK